MSLSSVLGYVPNNSEWYALAVCGKCELFLYLPSWIYIQVNVIFFDL